MSGQSHLPFNIAESIASGALQVADRLLNVATTSILQVTDQSPQGDVLASRIILIALVGLIVDKVDNVDETSPHCPTCEAQIAVALAALIAERRIKRQAERATKAAEVTKSDLDALLGR